jgi:serine/threonine protein kinase
MPGALQTDPLLDRLRQATLGEYDVACELGRGGMAAVYLAHDLALDRKVAIKVMLPDLLGGTEMVERFKREAKTAGSLSHPHIIPIYAVRDVDEMLFFVMKYVEGRSLDSVIVELGPLPLPMVQTILSQVAGALAHAHRRGVVHRDIKPANVMIDEEGFAVVTDFGIAKVQDASSLTSTGAAIGTPYYMSPEQGSGKPITGASDQYSLGIMAYEMLTGKTPFDAPSMMAVMSGHFFADPDPVRSRRPDCPEALESVVHCMLAKDPKDRFPSLDGVVAAVAAPTLAHDDPVRTQMVTLAKSGAKLQPRPSVPMSPVPPARRPRTAGAPRVSLTQRLRARPALSAGILLVLAALSVATGAMIGRLRNRTVLPLAAVSLGAPSSAAPEPRAPSPQPPDTSHLAAPSGAGPPTAPAPTASAKATRAPAPRPVEPRADTRAAAALQALRDSVARADSLARALQAQRQESLAAAARRAVPAPTPPTAAIPDTGGVLIGSRTTAAYYVDGVARGVLSGLLTLHLRAGPHRLSVNAEGCAAWDSTIVVRGGETVRVGYRAPRCP